MIPSSNAMFGLATLTSHTQNFNQFQVICFFILNILNMNHSLVIPVIGTRYVFGKLPELLPLSWKKLV